MKAERNKKKKTSQVRRYSNHPVVKEKITKARAVFEKVDMTLLEALAKKKAS